MTTFIRRWLRAPATAIVIIATLGITVGGVVTVFTAFDAVLLRDLPVRDADRLVRIAIVSPGGATHDLVPFEDFHAIRDASGPVRVAAFTGGQTTVRDPRTGRAEVAGVERVSDGFFDVAGVRLLRGTVPRVGERGAVVGERFASSSTISIDDKLYTVTGVAGFRGTNFANPTAVWIPLESAERVRVIGRLADGVSAADAERVLTSTLAKRDTRIRVGAERAMLISPDAPGVITAALTIAALLAAAVVLVAAGNIIGVLLARLAVRRRELAVRAALGATSGRISRQLIAEMIPLAIPLAVIAHLVAIAGSRLITLYLPASIAPSIDFTPSARTAAFAVVLSILATLVSGLAAAIHARRTDLSDLGARGGASGAPMTLRVLVVVQLAFTVVVLVAAGMLVQTARAYAAVNPGFESVNQLTVSYAEVGRHVERVRALSGVTHAAIATNTPLGRQNPVAITVHNASRDGYLTQIEGDYFGAAGIPLLQGRNLLPNENAAAVVNQAANVRVGDSISAAGHTYVVVGIARNAQMSSLTEEVRSHVWIAWDGKAPARILVRATRDLGGLSREIALLFGDATVTRLADVVDSDRWLARTASILAGALGLLTLLLAAVGLFGVVSTIVTSRRRELAVRLALGATPARVARLIGAGSARLFLAGLFAGSLLAVPAARALASFLFGVHAFDAASWIAVPAVIALVVAAATALPALRAMRTDAAELLQEI